jgi:hypothetical protein
LQPATRRRLETLRRYVLRIWLPIWRPFSLAGQYLLGLVVRGLVRVM